MSANPSDPAATRCATRNMSSATPSVCAYDSTRSVTSEGSGTNSISPSSINWTIRVRNTVLRMRMASPNSSGPSGATSLTSTSTPVIDSMSALSTARWTTVRPSAGATAVATPPAIRPTSSASGGVRNSSPAAGVGTTFRARSSGPFTGLLEFGRAEDRAEDGAEVREDVERVTRIELA